MPPRASSATTPKPTTVAGTTAAVRRAPPRPASPLPCTGSRARPGRRPRPISGSNAIRRPSRRRPAPSDSGAAGAGRGQSAPGHAGPDGRGTGPQLARRHRPETAEPGATSASWPTRAPGSEDAPRADAGPCADPDPAHVQHVAVEPVPAQVDLGLDRAALAEGQQPGDRRQRVQVDVAARRAHRAPARSSMIHGAHGQAVGPDGGGEASANHSRRCTLPPRG